MRQRERVQLRLYRRGLLLRLRLTAGRPRIPLRTLAPASGHMPKGATESVTDTEMCMPVDQCRQLLVELQDLRLKITAMERAGAEVVKGAQQRIPDTDQ